VINQQKIIN